MDFYNDLCDIFQEEHSFAFSNLYFESEKQFYLCPFQETNSPSNIFGGHIELPTSIGNSHAETHPELKLPSNLQAKSLDSRKTDSKFSTNEVERARSKKLKPSPYHNFQKHLNTALKLIITFPSVQPDSPKSLLIAQRLWTIFSHSENSTKKILSFIFNEFNEYRIKPSDLVDFGFDEVYAQYSKEQLVEARTLLAKMAIDQMDEENVCDYLETRRIKNSEKFRKYICVFLNELKEGFLKKRFTNKSRKQQILKELTKKQE